MLTLSFPGSVCSIDGWLSAVMSLTKRQKRQTTRPLFVLCIVFISITDSLHSLVGGKSDDEMTDDTDNQGNCITVTTVSAAAAVAATGSGRLRIAGHCVGLAMSVCMFVDIALVGDEDRRNYWLLQASRCRCEVEDTP